MKSSTSQARIPRLALSVVGALAAAAITIGSLTASATPIIAAGAPVVAKVQVCVVDPSGGSFNIVTTTSGPATNLVTLGTVNIAAGTCATVANDTNTGSTDNFTSTIQLGGRTLDHSDCQGVFAGTFNSCPGTTTSATVTTFANAFHGFTVQYTLVALPPVVTGCTVTRGFIRNQLDFLTNGIGKDIILAQIIVTNGGTALTPAQIAAALSTPGGGLIQLKAQLITALANISLGATTNAAVNAAIVSAKTLLTTNSTDKAAIGAAITTLTAFNEGTAGGGASISCTDAQEAVLKDKGLL